jgi:hypothetical protein
MRQFAFLVASLIVAQIFAANPAADNSSDSAKIAWTRAQKEFDAGQLEAAQADDAIAINAFPSDPAPPLLMAKIEFSRGQFLAARSALTAELTRKTDDAAAYATRAVVHAHLGNLAGAKADMNLSRKYDTAAAEKMRRKFDEEMSRSVSASPANLWDALRKSVDANESFDKQVAVARDLIKAEFSHRLFWDEWYQDHLRELEDDLRADPKNSGKLDAIGTFLLQECDDPGEQISPKGPYRAFRDAHPEDEIARAGKLFNDALALNPNDVAAMAGAAEIALRGSEFADGENLVRRAMQVDPNNPLILSQLAEILEYAGDVRAGNAMQLRTPQTWTTFVPGYVVYHTRYPSQAEQDQANQLDNIANQLWNEAREHLTAAVQSRAGTADGFYYQGLIDVRDQNESAAINDFQQATKLAPTSGQYRRALIHAYVANNQPDLAAVEQETLTLQRQTTANVPFVQAWNDLDRAAYESMQKDLDDAFSIDPADIRNALYRAVLAQSKKDFAESIKWNQVALAMNEASMRMDGLSTIGDAKTPLPAFAAAMPLAINLRIAARQRELRRIDAAWTTLQQNLSMLDRVPQQQWNDTSADAVIPNAVDTKAHDPPSIDYLAAMTHLFAGNTLLALHQYDESLKQFSAAARHPGKDGPMDAFLAQKKNINPHWAAYADMTRMYWAKNDPDASHRSQWLANARYFTWLSDDELRAAQQIQTNARQAQMNAQADSYMDAQVANLPPNLQEQRRKELERQRQYQQQRWGNNTGPHDPPGWPGQSDGK